MKIALILLACLVGLSYQQRFYLSAPFTPRFNYFPFFYGQAGFPQPYVYQVQDDTNQVAEYQADDAFARTKQLAPQKKFLLGQSPFGLFNNQGLMTSIVTYTWTSWTYTTGTATTATLQFCIPNNAFATSNVNGATVFSTGPCARRRREAALVDEILETLEPTEAKQVETSALPEVPQKRHVVDEPLLVSSKNDEVQESSMPLRRTGRAGTIYLTSTLTITSTATSFSFTATTFKKPITIGTGLLCLPSGLAIC